MDKIFGLARFSIHPGHEADFRRKASECLAAAQSDLAGTGAYEWFMEPGSGHCTVIEQYDGMEGMGRHIRQVGKLIPQLLEHARSEVTLLGDIDDAVLARVAGKLNATFGGRRYRGRLVGPAAPDGTVGADGIFAIAHFRLKPGTADRVKQLADEAFAIVEAKEPDTLAYEWFLNDDGSEVFVLDVYRNGQALAAHGANAGGAMKEIATLSERDIRIFGGLSEEARAIFGARPCMTYVAPRFQGIM